MVLLTSSTSTTALIKPPTIFSKLRTIVSPTKHTNARSSVSVKPAVSSIGFERVFCRFDEDGDGKISPAELRSCMRTVGEELSHEDAEAVVELSDSDGDGLLGFDDFVKLVSTEGEEEEEERRSMREAFSVYEMEGRGGCITAESLRMALEKLGEKTTVKDCRAMINHFDLNGDGVICFEEFRIMMH